MSVHIDWSQVTSDNLEQIEKIYSTSPKTKYKVTYRGYSVTIECEGKESEIQRLALEKMKEQYSGTRPETQIATTATSHQLFVMPPPLRKMVLEKLDDRDLRALATSLCTHRKIEKEYEPNLNSFKTQIPQVQNERFLQEILTDNPSWKAIVDNWKNVSLEDTVWLLRLYELRNLKINIPQIDGQSSAPCIPTEHTPNLLEPLMKEAIFKALAEAKNFIWTYERQRLTKVPEAICLLVNLKTLILNATELTSLPNVSSNVKLECLSLTMTKLTTPPDISRNVHLEHLNLSGNQFTTPPNVNKNLKLKHLFLHDNQLFNPPDVSHNTLLYTLNLDRNQLTTPPNVSNNVELVVLYLDNNKLTTSPNVTQNVKLTRLYLDSNLLTAIPDVSKNTQLWRLKLAGNQLTQEAREQLAKVQDEINQRNEKERSQKNKEKPTSLKKTCRDYCSIS